MRDRTGAGSAPGRDTRHSPRPARAADEYNRGRGRGGAGVRRNCLVWRGVKQSRLAFVSYGEERPLCTEHSEEWWAKNRRAHFLAKRGWASPAPQRGGWYGG